MPSLTGDGTPEAALGSANENAGAAQAAAATALERRNVRRLTSDFIAGLGAAKEFVTRTLQDPGKAIADIFDSARREDLRFRMTKPMTLNHPRATSYELRATSRTLHLWLPALLVLARPVAH